MSNNAKSHIAIIGAGLGGLAAAIGIARAGHQVTIVEQAPELGEVGSGIQIPPNASRIFKQWGILEEIEEFSVKPVDITIRRYHDGKILSVTDIFPHTVDHYGAPYLQIHRADYHRVLTKTARDLGVQIQLGSAVTDIDFETPAVRIAGKPDVYADLIIGADGLKSVCREKLLGRPDPPRLTGQMAYRAVISTEDMLKHPELAELVNEPRMTYWTGPDSHVVGYPLKRGGMYNAVLARTDNLPEMVHTMKADLQEMHDFFSKWDPKFRTLLSLVKETSKWKLQNSDEMESWSHPSGKFVLMGDACHATLPYMAQGAAIAVEDGAALGALFEKIENKEQLRDVLVIYEAIRKQRTSKVVKRSTLAQSFFHMPDGERQRERDRQLLEEEPFEGFPNHWSDPVLQKWLFGYAVEEEVDKAWKTYKAGRFPLTFGHHLSVGK
ncbi:hypothetical protein MBLNU457_3295t3 [Dothideomycetes sp. NU457]